VGVGQHTLLIDIAFTMLSSCLTDAIKSFPPGKWPPLLDIEKVYSQEHTHVLVCWDSLKTVYMYLLMLSY